MEVPHWPAGGLQGDETLARQGRQTTSRKPLARTE